MQWWIRSVAAAALVLPVAALAGLGQGPFTASDPQAVIMVEEYDGMRGGEMLFIEIDPVAMTVLKRNFGIRKEIFTDRLKTKVKELQTVGENPIWTGFSRFSAIKRPAGVFAFEELKWDTQFGNNTQCMAIATPVFRFKAGTANLIPVSALPLGGYANGEPLAQLIFYGGKGPRFRRSGEGDSLVDAQTILDERPAIKAKVEYAEVLGYVAWKDSKGQLSGCRRKGQMVWVTPEMAKAAVSVES